MLTFRDRARQTRLEGDLYSDGTPGDVLTVQPGGKVTPAPGGGSQAGQTIFHGTGAPTDPENSDFSINGAVNTSGTFKLTFRTQTTAPIAFDATGAEIAAALELLPAVGAGNAIPYPGYETATPNDGTYVVFIGTLGGAATETPSVTDDTTDNGITTADDSVGAAGVPAAAVSGDVYVNGDTGVSYLLDALIQSPVWRRLGVPVPPSASLVAMADGTPVVATLDEGADGTALFVDPGKFLVYGKDGAAMGSNDWLAYLALRSSSQVLSAWGIKASGHETISAAVGVPADAVVARSEQVQYFDDTDGAPVMRFKRKSADGTLTAGVSLSSTGSQDTVGAAGGAAALPATPSKYVKITDDAGNHYVIPAYAV